MGNHKGYSINEQAEQIAGADPAKKRPGRTAQSLAVIDMNNEELSKLADKVMNARIKLDMELPSTTKRRFPIKEFNSLFDAVVEYSAGLGKRDWLHRTVAREIGGIREYLQLESFRTPGEIIAQADRIEVILFSGYDAYLDEDEPPLL